ncbi:hypothetical protein FA15DRAFT_759311 [Coprinopsis marcescibilis]|uniref:DUF6533 domain-containing protein n=1 Tax=Coprinopsis marcescibilis TaxID=230819 RepID=A0A5C3KK70_COPMA|nr:hypothetical protein FA15DRAFT_759311 [Coprinopsis marcescibilis]
MDVPMPGLSNASPAEQMDSIQYNVYAYVASTVIIISEYLETIELEASVIWPVERSAVKVLYFVNRILPALSFPFMIAYNLTTSATHTSCKILFTIPSVGIVACILISEAILYIRVLALSQMSKKVLVFIVINGAAVSVTIFALLGKFIALSSWGASKYSLPGCYGEMYDGILITIAYTIALYSGIMVALLCVYFGIKIYWVERHGPLVSVFYRDGTLYFIALALLSIGNGVAASLMPPHYRFLMAPLQAVAHSAISTRMILHLKERAREGIWLSTACPSRI